MRTQGELRTDPGALEAGPGERGLEIVVPYTEWALAGAVLQGAAVLAAGAAILVATCLMVGTAAAQTGTPSDTQTATAPAAAPAAPAPPSAYHQVGMDFSFLFDGYVDANFNNPSSGWNSLRNFDMRSDTLHFNMGKITIDRAPGPVGFHLDVGFGEIFSVIHAADQAPKGLKYIEQAYVDFKPKSWKGVEVDVGEFVSAAGAEVIDVNQNWNYSRSLLFAWAVPYYHFGIRTSFPVGAHFTGGVQLVNGWNNVYASNQGKLIGLNGAYAWKKATWTNVWYGGPERDKNSPGWRNLFDSVVQVNPNDNLSLYLNFDYGRNKNVGPDTAQWTGIAGAARRAVGKKGAITGRVELFDDVNGFSTGLAQTVKEFTLTGEYKFSGWLLSRLEFRDDWSSQPFFEKGQGDTSKNQPTVLLGMVAYFGPKK
jgi:hypothetical protein